MFHRSPVHLIPIPTSVFGFPKFTLVDDPGCPKSHSFGNKSSMRWDASISKTGRIHIFLHFYWSELKIVIESILTKNGFGKILGGFPFSKLWLTEEEKVGGRVADELDERLPHHLQHYQHQHHHREEDEDHDDLGELRPRTEDIGAGVEWKEKPDAANLKTLTSRQWRWWL